MKRIFQLLLKLLIACALLAFVLRQADFGKIAEELRSLRPEALCLALVPILIAHVILSERMRFLLSTRGILLSRLAAVKLYFVGTLFNFVLPSGVGGDAVKAWAIRKQYDLPLASVIRILILDRASGLFMLCLLVLGILLSIDIRAPYITTLAWLGLPIVTISYFYLAKRFFGQRVSDGIEALCYTAAAQSCWALVVVILWFAAATPTSSLAYVLLYAAGSIVALLPISIGGLGLREGTFYYGSQWLKQSTTLPADMQVGVAISLALFCLYLLSALPGAFMTDGILPKKAHKTQ